jgi:hypothetical protein
MEFQTEQSRGWRLKPAKEAHKARFPRDALRDARNRIQRGGYVLHALLRPRHKATAHVIREGRDKGERHREDLIHDNGVALPGEGPPQATRNCLVHPVISTADGNQTDCVEPIWRQAPNETLHVSGRIKAVYRIQKNEMFALTQLFRLRSLKRDQSGLVWVQVIGQRLREMPYVSSRAEVEQGVQVGLQPSGSAVSLDLRT